MRFLSLNIAGPDGGSVQIQAPRGIPQGGPTTLGSIITAGFELLLLFGILACLFMLIWGGFDWMMSEGDKQKVGNARQKLVFAIIGLVIMLMSYFIINLIYGFFFGKPINFLGGLVK